MIKICHITTKHAAFDTRIFYKECQALKSRYHVVLMVANADSQWVDGIEITGFPYRSGSNLHNLIHLLKRALKQEAAVYHIHDPELLPLARVLKLWGKKIIYDVHENYRESLKEHRASVFIQKTFNYFDHWAAKNCAFILAERSYIPLYQGKARSIAVVENFCDPEELKTFRTEDRTAKNNMVCIGTLHTHRGAIVMLEVLHILVARGHDLRLDLIGKITEPGLMTKIEGLPYYSKIKSRLSWHGQLNLHESYRIAEESFVGLCLLDAMPNHTESYPTKLFEYMAVGLPIVASNISLYRAVVERRECGICAAYSDPEAIADAIEKIYTNKSLIQEFSKNGPPAVSQNYNWNTEKNILIDFYRTTLSN